MVVMVVSSVFSPHFLLCPSPCRKRDWVTTVTQLFDKMAEGGIPNKRFRDKPHSSLSCFAMRLKPGQEIRECLLSYVKENNLKAPFVLSCVGSVTSATLRLANVSKDTPNEVSWYSSLSEKEATEHSFVNFFHQMSWNATLSHRTWCDCRAVSAQRVRVGKLRKCR